MRLRNPRVVWGELSRTEKLQYTLLGFIRITLVVAIITGLYNREWMVLFVSSMALLLTFLPRLFESKYNIDLPIELEIFAVIFIYSAMFLGEVHGYYTRFWWWDVVLHIGSAIALGFVGFTILYVLHKNQRIRASPRAVALFSFFFAVGTGAIWEIFEFSMDQFFGLNMQKSGLMDTMWDLIIDAGGALVASFAGYFYLKRKSFRFLDKIMENFVKNNPELFNDD